MLRMLTFTAMYLTAGSIYGQVVVPLVDEDGSMRVTTVRINPKLASPIGQGIASLINNNNVRDALELSDSQIEELAQTQVELHQQRMLILKEFTKRAPRGDQEKFHQEYKRAQGEIHELEEQHIGNVLLPHQMKRLSEIGLQLKLEASGSAGMLFDQKVKKELEIDAEQEKDLRERIEAAEHKLREDIAKLKAQAHADVLQGLTASQRKRLKELVGDKWESK